MKRLLVLIVAIALIITAIVFINKRGEMDLPQGEETVLGPEGDSVARDIGDAAPNFALLDYNGTIHQLDDYIGKQPIVLNFWASWCPFCVNEMPEFQTVADEDDSFKLIAINRGESLEKARSFTDPMGLTYLLLLNRADDVARAYNLNAMPSTYFIDASGKVVDINRGPMSADEFKAKLNANFKMGEQAQPSKVDETLFPAELPEDTMSSSRTVSVTDGVRHSVPIDDIRGGGPQKDGIPSIDNPKFVSIAEANNDIDDDGLGIAVSFNGVNRFYPVQILNWHEIVNDQIGDQPLLITFCPLCGTGIVFEPLVKGVPTEFGTSGKLWNSNLIMYDRQTDTYWSQVLGEAIVGELTGTKLKLLPHQNILYRDWKNQHPNGEVLSTDTGFLRSYSRSPYGDYDNDKALFFPVDNEDSRFHPKAPTYQIEANNVVKIYPIEELDKGEARFSDTVGGAELTIVYDSSTKRIDIRDDDGQEVIPAYGFWFSVIAVYPDAEVYTG